MKILRRFVLWIAALTFTLALLSGIASLFLLNSLSASTVLVDVATRFLKDQLQCRSVTGPVAGPLDLEGCVYEDQHVRVEVSRAHIAWTLPALMAYQLRVGELDVGDLSLTLKPSPEKTDEPALTRLPVALLIQQAKLDSFTLITEPGAEPLRFEKIALAAEWSGDEIEIDHLATYFAPVGALTAKGSLQLQGHALVLENVDLGGLGAVHLEKGLIGYDNHIEFDGNWKDLRWPQEGEAVFFSPQGELQAEGTWDEYEYKTQTSVQIPWIAEVRAQGIASLKDARFERAVIQTLDGEVRTSGAITWLPEVTVQASGDFSKLNPQTLDEEWPGVLNGSFEGSLESLEPLLGRLKLSLRDSKLRGHALALQAQAQTQALAQQNKILKLQQFELRSGESKLSLQGQLQPQFDLAGTLSSANLGELWPGLSGSAEASARLRGTLEQPAIQAKLLAEKLKYSELAVTKLGLQLDLNPKSSTPSAFKLELYNAVAGINVESLVLSGEGTTAQNKFTLDTRTDVGQVQLGFAGKLYLPRREWRGQVRSGRGEPLRLSAWELQDPADLQLGLNGYALSPLCWKSSTGRACVQSQMGGGETRAAFRVEKLVLAYFEPLMPPGWKVKGDVSGTGRILQREGHLEAEADLGITPGEVTIGNKQVIKFAAGSWLAQETSKGFVSKLSLPLAQGGIYWDALLSPSPNWEQRRWSGELRADLTSLQPLRLFSPELESVDGHLTGRFAISGVAGAPRLDGGLRLREGKLRLATPGIEMTAVTADLDAKASGAVSFSASAQSGGGSLQMKGSADSAALATSVQLELSGENFQALGSPQARVWVTPKLSFKLSKDRADLKGEVQVPHAEITPTTFDQGVAPSSDQVIVGADGEGANRGLLKIYTDVRILLGEKVTFNGFGLATQLQGGLQAFDEPGRPTTARGEVRLLGGRYTAYGQDLSITTGKLIFTGGPITEPVLDIRAEREATEEVKVGLNIRGTLDAPEFSLFSTPAMPQDQQLSWLILGRPLQENSSTSGADRNALSGAAMALGLSGGNYFAQKLRGSLRLDEISIGSKPGETSDQAQLTLGKYLSPKLFVSYGIGLFQPGQAFRLLYDIGHGFKLATESGVESGGDIFYTVEK